MSRLEYVIVSGGNINHFLMSEYIKVNDITKIIAADKGLEMKKLKELH